MFKEIIARAVRNRMAVKVCLNSTEAHLFGLFIPSKSTTETHSSDESETFNFFVLEQVEAGKLAEGKISDVLSILLQTCSFYFCHLNSSEVKDIKSPVTVSDSGLGCFI